MIWFDLKRGAELSQFDSTFDLTWLLTWDELRLYGPVKTIIVMSSQVS